jgi:hypothetical protein
MPRHRNGDDPTDLVSIGAHVPVDHVDHKITVTAPIE